MKHEIINLPLLVLILAILLAGCAPQPGELQPAATQTTTAALAEASTDPLTAVPAKHVDLNVFAAASLTDAFGEIGKLFEANHPGVSVILNFAGSQQLAQQINEGAPADVFASANQKQMDFVVEAGEIVTGTQHTFARNRLVAIYPQGNPADLKALEDLAKPGLKLVLAAKEVPVGQYALDFFDKATADPAFGLSYKDSVMANVVSYEENVKSVLSKVALGEADAGIVYSSDISGNDDGKVGRIDIPDALNVIATYPIAPLKASQNLNLAQAFINMVLSPDGQNILAKNNFIRVK
jgi:molybdate transport system substrate-binding protein